MRNLILMLTMPPMGFVMLLVLALCLRDRRRFVRWQAWGRRLAWLSRVHRRR